MFYKFHFITVVPLELIVPANIIVLGAAVPVEFPVRLSASGLLAPGEKNTEAVFVKFGTTG